ncbi:MAG: 2Fe-2S iron-sulfur cluster-binding protein [Cytophagaceae bacterium]
MSSLYYNLKVKEIIKETEDAVTIVLEQPSEKISYKPGQFLTLIVDINGEKVRRSYSLCSAETIDEDLAFTVKRIPGGKVSNFLPKKLNKGDTVEIMQPMGTFSLDLHDHNKRDIVLLGAGSGITPLMSILKSVLHREPLSNVYLIYGNRNENSIIFKDKLEEMERIHEGRLKIIHVLSQPLDPSYRPSGRLNRSEFIKLLEWFSGLDFKKADYFLCGPEGMMTEAKEALQLLQVPESKVHKESFVTTGTAQPAGEVVQEEQGGPQQVTVIYQGTEYKFTVSPDKTILEAALKEKIDLPFSCQSGLCTACMGKCVSGKVHLDESDALSDKEIESGYVLTCVGHPVTSNVVIEID